MVSGEVHDQFIGDPAGGKGEQPPMRLKTFCHAIVLITGVLPPALLAQERYTVSYAGFAGFQAPIWAAKDFGLFAKYGLDTDLVMIPGSARGTQALVGGSLHFAQTEGTSVVTAINHGADIVLIA